MTHSERLDVQARQERGTHILDEVRSSAPFRGYRRR